MPDIIQAPNQSTYSAQKLKDSLEVLSRRVREDQSGDLAVAMTEATSAFKRYFDELASPVFKPKSLKTGDTARSEVYNNNLEGIFQDIKRMYEELDALAEAQVSSYNYSQIVNEELVRRADGLASTVLDLNILSNFTRGDVIVAGDDFRNLDNVDQAFGTASPAAELLMGGSGLTLARADTNQVAGAGSLIEINPIAPVSDGSDDPGVNTQPTPGNIGRLYEGSYYNFLGLARPEGGRFNFKYVVNQDAISHNVKAESDHGVLLRELSGGTVGIPNARKSEGFYLDLGADEEDKKLTRLNMLDNDPNTFWEAEYVYRVSTPLLGDLFKNSAGEQKNQEGKVIDVRVDLAKAEQEAQKYDFNGRDLILDLVITMPEIRSVNMVALDPMLFGSRAFINVADISTTDSEDGAFTTVDGWDRIRFAKTITPEANEFLTDSQLGKTLAPSRFAYRGQGIYPFPVRRARKIKVRLVMETPVPAPYERYYIMLKNRIEAEIYIERRS